MDKPRIAYIFPRSTTFVQKDIRMLEDYFHVKVFDGKVMGASSLLSLFFREFLFLLANPSCKVYVCMFAGYHALLPGIFARLFGKKLIVMPGGADAVSFPELGYGNFRKNPLAWATAQSYRLSNQIVPVSESLIFQNYTYQPSFGQQGYKHFVQNLKSPSTAIANGYSADFWKPAAVQRNPKLFLTVATHVETAARRTIKGLDLFIQLAHLLPEYEFMIVGCSKTHLGAVPSNLMVIERAQPEDLIRYYSGASFYVQLSMSEGFPNALCEAMLCECVPIVSAVGAMPEIVGETGFILKEKSESKAVQLLNDAYTSGSYLEKSQRARNRIATLYTENKRKSALSALIQDLIKK